MDGDKVGELSLDLRINTELAGHTIGRGGQRITDIRKESGASLKIHKDEVRNLRGVFVAGTRDQILQCIELVFQDRDEKHSDTLVEVLVPSAVVGCLIGQKGASAAEIRESSGARIAIQRTPAGPQERVRIVEVEGSYGSVRHALCIMLEKMDDEGNLGQYCSSSPDSARNVAAIPSARGQVLPDPRRARAMNSLVAPAMPFANPCGGYAGGPYGQTSLMVPELVDTPRRYGAANKGDGEVSLNLRVSPELAGHTIGKGGQRITEIRKESGASLKIEKEETHNMRGTFISGTHQQVLHCIEWIFQDRDEHHAETSAEVLVPSDVVGSLIGHRGSTISEIRASSGARVTIERTPPGPQDPVRIVEVAGSYMCVRKALGIMLDKMEDDGKGGAPSRPVPTSARVNPAPMTLPPFGSGIPCGSYDVGGPCGGYFGGCCGGCAGSGGCTPSAYPMPSMANSAYAAVRARAGCAGPVAPYGIVHASGAVQGSGRHGDLGKSVLSFGCSNQVAGRLIGKGGATISDIRKASGAKFKVEESPRPDVGERFVSIDGNEDEVERCIYRAFEILDDSFVDPERKDSLGNSLEVVVLLPDKHAAAVIGRGGENIQAIRRRTPAKIKLEQDAMRGAERKLKVAGSLQDVKEGLMGVVDTLFKEVIRG